LEKIMPAKAPRAISGVSEKAALIGQKIRTRRKELGVSAVSAAEAAEMSRITWHRIEKGELSVTLGAYLNALKVLDLEFRILHPSDSISNPETEETLPEEIEIAAFPQLRKLAWHIPEADRISPREAFDIYERHRRHLDPETLEPYELDLIAELRRVFSQEG
jgi:transcriptional regulator with XRE-family HTH domain